MRVFKNFFYAFGITFFVGAVSAYVLHILPIGAWTKGYICGNVIGISSWITYNFLKK